MKKLLFLSMIIFGQSLFSQVTLAGNKLMKEGQTYKMSQYAEVFKNPDASSAFKLARTNKTIGQIMAGVGGFGVGWGIVHLIANENAEHLLVGPYSAPVKIKPNNGGAWTEIGIGLGVIGVSIPFMIAANKNAKKAIEIENGNAAAFKPYFKLESAGKGIALSYNF